VILSSLTGRVELPSKFKEPLRSTPIHSLNPNKKTLRRKGRKVIFRGTTFISHTANNFNYYSMRHSTDNGCNRFALALPCIGRYICNLRRIRTNNSGATSATTSCGASQRQSAPLSEGFGAYYSLSMSFLYRISNILSFKSSNVNLSSQMY